MQRVKLDGKLCDIIPVHNGIAQGTVLGPILFIFYINDIFKTTKYVKMSLFADDCVIYLLGNNWSTVKRRIQRDFDAIIEWSIRNNLRLNHGKTKATIFGTRSRLSNLHDPSPFKMGVNNIDFVNSHTYLGIPIDATMSLTPLVKNIKKRVSDKLFMLRKIRKFLTFDASVTVYKQTIMPIIDYTGFMLISCKKEDKNDLQKLQNDVLRICTRNKMADRVSIP